MNRYFAPCPKGLEYLLVEELTALGAREARESLAGVGFYGEERIGYTACLWSRLASRILLEIADFELQDAEGLYSGINAIPWHEHMLAQKTFAIEVHGTIPAINNTLFAAQKTKDAIVDRMRAEVGERPSVDANAPDFIVHVVLKKNRARVSIDFSGRGLFRRGYRQAQGAAPLKENLAAAMLLRARWPSIYQDGGAIVDPFCGSGTLLVEAAMMVADIAPGLRKKAWGFESWKRYNVALWQDMLAEAQARAKSGTGKLRPVFFGRDEDAHLLEMASRNAAEAELADFMHLERATVDHLQAPPELARGLVITNPPYGVRLRGDRQTHELYQALGQRLKLSFAGWQAAVITSEAELGWAIGLRANRQYQLFNGAIECMLLCFDGIYSVTEKSADERALPAGAEALKNRLQKNLQRLKSWLRRERVAAFRCYDADLPEYAAAIDVYGRHLHIQEYAPPKSIPADVAEKRLAEIVRVAGQVFDVPRQSIAVKTRKLQPRGESYGKFDDSGLFFEVEEGGLKFLVNVFDYLDTGLFLDHRAIRARIQALAAGKRFLNLFCYTASATVYAAAGGAVATTSVDLSRNYLEWGGRNLASNGFMGQKHQLVQADVMDWLAAEKSLYDLIFVAPPTFSNSKKARDFDMQQQHAELIERCARLLAADGTIIFSSHYQRFKPDHDAIERLGMTLAETSARTVPADFARSPKIHRSFELRKIANSP